MNWLFNTLDRGSQLAQSYVAEARAHGLLSASRRAVEFTLRGLTGQGRYRYRPATTAADAIESIRGFAAKPLISIIMPVHNTPPRLLQEALDSVTRQYYPHWELCITDDASSQPETLAILENLHDPRILQTRHAQCGGISAATNSALKLASGEYVTFLDHDDALTEDALLEVVRAINLHGADLYYSDEDYISEYDALRSPHFKPDFSPDLLLSHNYITHLVMLRRSLIEEIGGLRSEFDGAQDHDLLLRVTERSAIICHISQVLYHWRTTRTSTSRNSSAKPYSAEAGRRAVQAALERRGIPGSVEHGTRPHFYRTRRVLPHSVSVSVLIPFRDQVRYLQRCLTSLLAHTPHDQLEILCINNGSREPATHEFLASLPKLDQRIRVLDYDYPFNYSAMNNWAARQASGDHLVLMNSDISVLNNQWLPALLEHSQRPEVGAVGAKLYYDNGRIQHAGVIVGICETCGHAHRFEGRNSAGYFNRLNCVQNFSAVTAALMMVKRATYHAIGGLDEERFGIAFNDVDFCLRLRELGLLNVYTPYCEAWHSESVSRGYEITAAEKQRSNGELEALKGRHPQIFCEGDPYYNRNLSLLSERFALRDFREPWPAEFPSSRISVAGTTK